MRSRTSRQRGRESLAQLCYQAANQDPLRALDLAATIYTLTRSPSLYPIRDLTPDVVARRLNNQEAA